MLFSSKQCQVTAYHVYRVNLTAVVRAVRVPFVGVYDDGSKTAINSIGVLPTYGLAVHRVQGAPVEFGTAKERPSQLMACGSR